MDKITERLGNNNNNNRVTSWNVGISHGVLIQRLISHYLRTHKSLNIGKHRGI